MADNFDAADRAARLRLIRSGRIGPISYMQLLARFGTAQAALDALPALAARGGGRAPQIADAASIEREMERVAKLGGFYLFRGEEGYPRLLAEVDTAPPALICRGDMALLARPGAAMVGARNASAAACRFARGMAQGLGEHGLAVISGLARGIDTAAHHGALSSGTIAAIASGLDVVFPPENAQLQEEVATRGLIVTEHPPGTQPLARHFPSRNRIIAGLALGTVVVEAAPRSGSLITARLAAEAGREVMAVPGFPADPRAQGCNELIRDGATLVQSAADVVESIGAIDGRMVRQDRHFFTPAPVSADASDNDRRAVVDLMSMAAVPVDELIRQTGLPPMLVQTVLLEMDLAGRLQRHAGGRVSLA